MARYHLFPLTSLLLAVTPLMGAELSPSTAPPLPPLPEPISSFGAAVVGDALYVYSGHIGTAHAHSTENVSKKFSRLRLNGDGEWESLPVGPGLQSPALVAYQNSLYRVGGLMPRNAPKEPDDLKSLADFEKFDPQTGKWTALKPLPEGRSSHDAVVVGDKLYVVGGWNLGAEENWLDQALVIDLSKDAAEWTPLPTQPFKRRALAAAFHDGKVYAIGGMGEKGPSLDVHCYDIASNKWLEGPSVPAMSGDDPHGATMNGFGCSAFGVGKNLFLSTMDGKLFRLADDGKSWQAIGQLQTPRFFHRLLPHGDELLIVGGASMKVGHLDSIERISLGDGR